MENKSSNWDQDCCNIFRVCHRVQTLTQTVCPFRSCVIQAGPAPLIVHLGTKAEHMYVYTLTRAHTNILKSRICHSVFAQTDKHALVGSA